MNQAMAVLLRANNVEGVGTLQAQVDTSSPDDDHEDDVPQRADVWE